MLTRFIARLQSTLLTLLLGSLLLVGLLLVPDLTPDDITPTIGEVNARGVIVEELPPGTIGEPRYLVELLDGAEVGARVEASYQDASGALPGSGPRSPYRVGDEIVVTRFVGPAGGFAIVAEPWRVPVLVTLVAIFAVVIGLVGGLRGLRALLALALTLAAVLKLVVPLFIAGWDPVLLAVGVAGAVTLATLLITEGPTRTTLAALLGTFAALALTAGLAAVFNEAARFTALQGREEIAFLIPLIGDRADLQGILLAATVFGALGVLDDVTVTQAAAVEQLHHADPESGRGVVIARAMRVGRSHIAATVNTLVLAYLGAGLPLLLLFALSGQPAIHVLNGELLAVEVIRAAVGSIGIVLAVPLTTLVAGLLLVPGATRAAGPPVE